MGRIEQAVARIEEAKYGKDEEVLEHEFEPDAEVASKLPVPTGWRILITMPESSELTEGGIAKAEETRKLEEIGSVCAFVLTLGPDAYKDKAKFPTGPWCKEGDWVMMRSYSGTRFSIFGKEFRIVNDSSIEAVVGDPRGIMKL